MPGSDTPDSFSDFYDGELFELVRFLVMCGASSADAWDAAQDAFLQAFRHWSSIEKPRAWVRVTARRMHVKRQLRIAGDEERAVRADWVPRPEFDKLEIPEQERMVLRMIAELPPRQRQVFAYCYDGFSNDEIAHILHLRKGAVASNLYQARRALKQKLGGPVPDDDSGGTR